MLIISIFLCLSPLVGEGAGVIGFSATTGTRIALLIDMAGNLAMTAVDIVQDPEAAPVAVLGLLLGGVAGRNPERVSEVARAKRLMKAENLGKLGDVFKKNDNLVISITKACRKA